MGRVDPEDDGVRRFVARHYRYDPQRHERALAHGVAPGHWMDELEMPSNVAVLHGETSAGAGPRWAGRFLRPIPRWSAGSAGRLVVERRRRSCDHRR